jgi:putative endonuclease
MSLLRLEPARARLGRRGETLARRLLTENGYLIEAANVRFPVGELDLVARQGGTLCFIEVRSVSSDEWGGPLASIDGRKRRRILRAAQWYLKRYAALPEGIRFDVVAIQWGPGPPRLELIRGAFEAGC